MLFGRHETIPEPSTTRICTPGDYRRRGQRSIPPEGRLASRNATALSGLLSAPRSPLRGAASTPSGFSVVLKRSFAKLKSSKVNGTPASSVSSRGLQGLTADEPRSLLLEPQPDQHRAGHDEVSKCSKAPGSSDVRRRAVAWAEDFDSPVRHSNFSAPGVMKNTLEFDPGFSSTVDNDRSGFTSNDIISRSRGRLPTGDRPLAVEDLSALLSLEHLCDPRFAHYQSTSCFEQHSNDALSPQDRGWCSGVAGSPSFSQNRLRVAHNSVEPQTPTESLAASSDLRDCSVLSSDLCSFNEEDLGTAAASSDEDESTPTRPERHRSSRERSHGRVPFTRPTRHRYPQGVPSVLFAEVYETELQLSSQAQQRTTNLTLGCGSPAQGTRHRIRCRVSFPLGPSEYSNVMPEATSDDMFIDGLLADGNVISEDEVDHIRKTIWYPEGKNIPSPHSIRLGYHTAWDIGKRGCIALKLRTIWESTANPSRLRFFLMDGTDPYSFLSIYSKTDLLSESTGVTGHSYRKKTVLTAQEVREGIWDYEAGRVVIRCQRRGGRSKVVIIDRLPRHFTEAILVCIREMAVHQEINYLRTQRLRAARLEEYRRLLDRRQTQVRCTFAGGAALEVGGDGGSNRSLLLNRTGRHGAPDASIAAARQFDSIADVRSESRRREIGSIGPARKPAKGVVTPSQSVVASLVAAAAHRNRGSGTGSNNSASAESAPGRTSATVVASGCSSKYSKKSDNLSIATTAGGSGISSSIGRSRPSYYNNSNYVDLRGGNRLLETKRFRSGSATVVYSDNWNRSCGAAPEQDCTQVVRGPRKGTRNNRRNHSRGSRRSSSRRSANSRSSSIGTRSNRSRSVSVHRSASA